LGLALALEALLVPWFVVYLEVAGNFADGAAVVVTG
jgi:hypothetical protein